MKAVCHHSTPPDDCPLRDWPPPGIVAVWIEERQHFAAPDAYKCNYCGVAWTPDGEVSEALTGPPPT